MQKIWAFIELFTEFSLDYSRKSITSGKHKLAIYAFFIYNIYDYRIRDDFYGEGKAIRIHKRWD